jgi:ribosomal protein L16 Arg81 hydroxylase
MVELSTQTQLTRSEETMAVPIAISVYDGCYDKMQALLLSSYLIVAESAWANDLICDATKDSAIDKNKTNSARERVNILLDAATTKIKSKKEEAVTGDMLEAIKDTLGDDVYDYLKSQKDKPFIEVLKKERPKLVDLLTYNKDELASRLMAKGILTANEHTKIIDPASDHRVLSLTQTLKEIRDNMKSATNPSDILKKFIEEVIEELGPFAKELAAKLREGLDNNIN